MYGTRRISIAIARTSRGNSSNLITKINYSGKPQEGDRVYLTSSAAMNFRIAHTEKRIQANAEFSAKVGEEPVLKLTARDVSAIVKGKIKAQSAG